MPTIKNRTRENINNLLMPETQQKIVGISPHPIPSPQRGEGGVRGQNLRKKFLALQCQDLA
jgi:hypothetical protein